MENFIAYNPTKIHFGKDVISDLGKTIRQYGTNVLLIYGKGSVKNNGIYNSIMSQLKSAGVTVTEFGGIKPNPVADDVDSAVQAGRKNKVDVILAAGGGSVIDSAKIAALCISENHTAWNVMKGISRPQKALPLIAVLTLAATGSEMNCYAVLQNQLTQEKIGFGNPMVYPKSSFLDPQNTFSVPKDQTAYGIVDLIAHALESYFSYGEASLSDRFVESIIVEAMSVALPLLSKPDNYEHRAGIMWAASCALNGTTAWGRRTSGDWGAHDIGHTLSFLYDLPHGASLSIAYPAWLKFHETRAGERIRKLGSRVFGVDTSTAAIEKLEMFFKSISCPICLEEAGIGKNKRDEIIALMTKNKIAGYNFKFLPEDYRTITNLMY